MLEIGVIIAVALIVFGIGFFVLRKMPEGGKKKLIQAALLGLVTLAENKFDGKGQGAEKSEWVKSEIVKVFPSLADNDELGALITAALVVAKETVFDAAKKELK